VITELVCQNSLGSAVLYALAGSSAFIGLPEIVEMEVNRVLRGLAEKAVGRIRDDISLLRQLSGQRMTYYAPTSSAIRDGIEHRWAQLSGVLTRIPFSHEQAKSALRRVIQKSPPSGENNEQFRDCCIWEAALELSAERSVYLVTNDSAFYEGRAPARGLAEPLRQELAVSERYVRVYSSVRDFLATIDKTVAALDEASIGAAIIPAVTPRAHEIVRDAKNFELGPASHPRISGYATPQPSLVAVSFEISFKLKRVEVQHDQEQRSNATLHMGGVCSYDPNLNEVSEIEIREWSMNLGGSDERGWSGTSWTDPKSLEKQFSPSNIRSI
jgi:hypothetical protein